MTELTQVDNMSWLQCRRLFSLIQPGKYSRVRKIENIPLDRGVLYTLVTVVDTLDYDTFYYTVLTIPRGFWRRKKKLMLSLEVPVDMVKQAVHHWGKTIHLNYQTFHMSLDSPFTNTTYERLSIKLPNYVRYDTKLPEHKEGTEVIHRDHVWGYR